MYNGKAETTVCDSYTYSLSKGKRQELEDLVTDSEKELEALPVYGHRGHVEVAGLKRIDRDE